MIVIPQENMQPLMRRCKCQEIDKAKNQWRASGLNPDDNNKTFSTFEIWNKESEKMKNTATNFYMRFEKIKKTRRNSIMLCGNPGSGKTHLGIALANNFLKKNYRVVYMPYRSVITSLKQNIIDKEYYKKELSKYQMAEILLIDDLYKGKVNETDINIMFELINHRYLNNMPIIVSTEFHIESILNFDEAIGSRIYEMCKDHIVEISGTENNYRLR
jgi:DNA replication protein DnaC